MGEAAGLAFEGQQLGQSSEPWCPSDEPHELSAVRAPLWLEARTFNGFVVHDKALRHAFGRAARMIAKSGKGVSRRHLDGHHRVTAAWTVN